MRGGKAKTLIAGYGTKQGYGNIIGTTGFGSSGVAEPLRIKEATKLGYTEISRGGAST